MSVCAAGRTVISFWSMPSIYAFTGAGVAVLLEYLYRTTTSFWSLWWVVVPANVVISFVVYRLVTTPGATLIDAFVVWSFSTVALRVVVTIFLLDDVVRPGTWAALVLLLAARCAQQFWR